ncbi:MAG: hypothetical protein JXA25_04470 [Anaerolineales bacterium]|nr:hypothetical protein [Anaerolineales bacterium]
MKDRIRTCLVWIPRVIDLFLMAISPMVLLLLIVGVIMMMDTIGAHRRLLEKLEEVPHTTGARITSCYPEEYFCFADFIDENGIDRYGKLEWRYYSEETTARLVTLKRDDIIEVRYADYRFEDHIVLAAEYDNFLIYKGHIIQNGGIILGCWLILILHPEVMLVTLVDNLRTIVDKKWKRKMGQG